MFYQKFILLSGFFITLIYSISYKGYKTHVIMPDTNQQRGALGSLMTAPGIDFWSPPNSTQPTVMTSPAATEFFYNFMNYYNIPYETVVDNVADSLRYERNLQDFLSRRRSAGGNELMYLTKYLRFNEIEQSLKEIAKKYSPLCRLNIIGRSTEGRPIYMMKISNNFRAKKKVAMLEAGMHAREWAAPAMALHAIHEAIHNPKLLKSFEWRIIPSANPDGYEYTHTVDRFWRKTRAPYLNATKSTKCFGTDGNRNFGIHWSEIGASTDPCSFLYQGKSEFSEKETQAVRDAASKIKNRLKIYLALHSYGSFILYPFGHTSKLIPDWKDLDYCGKKAAKEIIKNGGANFTVGNSATVLYPSGAGSDDYARGVLGVKYAYTIELPGGGTNGFDLPPTGIEQMVNQVFPGLVTLVYCSINK